MIIFYLFVCASFLQTCLTDNGNNYIMYSNHKMYRIQGNEDGMDKTMDFLTENYDIPYHSRTEKGCHMLVAPELAPIVESISQTHGLATKVIYDDFSELIRVEKNNKRANEEFSWTAYYDVDDIYNYLQNMSDQHPQWAQLVVGGQSYEGRQILGLRINTPTDVNKPVMFIESDYGSSSNPCNYQTYAGSQPFSEIETRSLSEYISGLENMLGYISFHADAQMLLLPYSDSSEHIDNYDDLKQIGDASLRRGYAVNKAKYDGPGTASEILYKASGGSIDWVRYTQGTRLVYVYELRGRFFQWPASRIHEQGDEVTQMMAGLVSEARNLGYF
ncbi:hypothetical protein HF086_004375 [Spodoptera exigua]|uniref:Peptidase M14 carboxypeptidase A domain-containing protein n=1 Tax=Spodoptera exigua TaxID=7107 RepID=A0A922ME86_SPOEX|nr:hypothetical protein HF086_004375 [Spodoptera exigua]